MNYPHDIPSIAQAHPAFANHADILNNAAFLGILASRVAGTAINALAVPDAERTLRVLQESRGNIAIITHAVIETAENRVHLLRATHSFLEFGQHPGIGGPVQQQLNQIGNQLANLTNDVANLTNNVTNLTNHLVNGFARIESAIDARLANSRIASDNRCHSPDPFSPLQKSVIGDGHALAVAVCGQPHLPVQAQNHLPNAAIGAVPGAWNPHIDTYHHIDILLLIIFYNENFGILAGDTLAQRKEKLRMWLIER